MVEQPEIETEDSVEDAFVAREAHLLKELSAVHRTMENLERDLGRLVRENRRLAKENEILRRQRGRQEPVEPVEAGHRQSCEPAVQGMVALAHT